MFLSRPELATRPPWEIVLTTIVLMFYSASCFFASFCSALTNIHPYKHD